MNSIRDNVLKVIEFENNDKLLEFVIPGTEIPIWLLIRIMVYRLTTCSRAQREYFIPKVPYKHGDMEEMTVRNPYNSTQKDIVYAFFRNFTMAMDKEGKVYEDKFYHFMKYTEKNSTTLVAFESEEKFGFQCDYPDWKSDYAIRLEAEKGTKGRVDSERIREFITFLRENYPFDITREHCRKIMREVCRIEENLLPSIKACEKYLDIVSPKLVILCWGHYFDTMNVAMSLACRKRNIVTAEIQFSLFAEHTIAYHHSDSMINNKACRAIFPEYVLTRGQYWNDLLKSPSKRYVLGVAYLDGVKENPQNNKVLFTARDKYEEYAKFLKIILEDDKMDITIYFRLHPGRIETDVRKRFEEFERYENFRMANDKPFAHYLNDCSYIISDGEGTVDYEARALGRGIFNFILENVNESIDMKSDAYIFKNAEEFKTLWDKREISNIKKYSEYFDINWRNNYDEFLKEIHVNE